MLHAKGVCIAINVQENRLPKTSSPHKLNRALFRRGFLGILAKREVISYCIIETGFLPDSDCKNTQNSSYHHQFV